MTNYSFSSATHIIENHNYNVVYIEDSIAIPTVHQSRLSGIKLFYAKGNFYAKRQGLIIKLLSKNVESSLQDLSRNQIEHVINSKKPIKLSRNARGEYSIEYLTIY